MPSSFLARAVSTRPDNLSASAPATRRPKSVILLYRRRWSSIAGSGPASDSSFRPSVSIRLIEPYSVPGSGLVRPPVRSSTSRMIPYPCHSSSARANSVCNTAGLNGKRSRGSLPTSRYSPIKHFVNDISLADILSGVMGRANGEVYLPLGLQALLADVRHEGFGEGDGAVFLLVDFKE